MSKHEQQKKASGAGRNRAPGYAPGSFMAIVEKEITDHARSLRFIILLILIALTTMGSLFAALSNMPQILRDSGTDDPFFFLYLFSKADGTLPPFFVFIGFLGPLLGISLGFDAINSEHARGTLARVMSQPIPRDFLLNAKFTAGILVIGVMFFTLSFLVMGIGLIALGIPPTPAEFLRVVTFTLVSILYVSFWLNLSILFSVKFRHAATSALSGIAVWLFFTVFYPLIVDLATKGMQPGEFAHPRAVLLYEKIRFGLLQVIPNEMFSQVTSALLVPSVRSVGPLSVVEMQGAVPGVLPTGQSILIVWPQLTGLLALTMVCFLFSYRSFMRREIRSR